MFLHIINATKQKIIAKIRERKVEHPDFDDVYIGNKLPRKDLPNKAIIITNASASQIKLGSDDFIQTVKGYATIVRVVDKPGLFIEWIKEIGSMVPGYYYLKVVTYDSNTRKGTYSSTPVYKRRMRFDAGASDVTLPVEPFEMRMEVISGNLQLLPPAQFVYDPSPRTVIFTQSPLYEGYVEFLEEGPVNPSIPFTAMVTSVEGVPGVALAIGERIKIGDEQAVIISPTEDSQYEVRGGRFNLSLDITAYAQDPQTQERLVDYVSTWLWQERVKLTDEHVAITDISIGGESIDSQVTIAGIPFFQASLTLAITVDWEVHIPLVRRITEFSLYQNENDGNKTDEEIAEETKSIFKPYKKLPSQHVSFICDARARLVVPALQVI